MKNYFCILLIFMTIYYLKAEESKDEIDSLIKLDFSVPDIPAMKALSWDNSNILRPTTPGELGIQLSKFFNNNNLSLPSSFAIEVSPSILYGKQKSLKEYLDHICWNNLRLSLGSFKDTSNNTTNVAIGLRWTYDFGYINSINKENEFLEKRSVFIDSVTNNYLKDKFKIEPQDRSKTENSDKLKEATDYSEKKFVENVYTIKEKVNDDFWNKAKVDFAFACVSNSKDSTVKDMMLKSYYFWGTGTFPFSPWWQTIVGVKFGGSRNIDTTKFLFNYGFGIRFYFGQNNIKAFIEYSYDKDRINENFISNMLNLGIEFKLTTNTWIVYSVGWESSSQNSINNSNLNTNLDFKYNFAEIINLFK